MVQPGPAATGRAVIRKTGRVVRGRIVLTADPVVAGEARVAYRTTLRRLLARAWAA